MPNLNSQKIIIALLLVLLVMLFLVFIFLGNIKSFFSKSTPPSQPALSGTGVIATPPDKGCGTAASIKIALEHTETTCTLDLTGQNLTTIPQDLTMLKNLTTIILKNNKLTEFPEALTNIPSLLIIDLSNNGLKDIPVSAQKLLKLQKLDLRDNPISQENKSKIRLNFPLETKIIF